MDSSKLGFEPQLNDNDKIMFYKYLDKCTNYFEYGSGGSTYQAAIRSNIKNIYSVENNSIWYEKMKLILKNSSNVKYLYCNMKTIDGTAGRPAPGSTLEQWIDYSSQIKKLTPEESKEIDVVLIDGRFRVASCLNCFNVLNDDCYIIFDDFLYRPQYHVVLDYYEIIEKTDDNRMVVLKKKREKTPPPPELIEKYEKDSD